MSPKQPEPPARRRRSTDEVRRRIIDAAEALFAEQGFEGTTTRQIASRAGVVEPLVFRQFGSKAGLLEAVVVEPLTDFVERFTARWHDEMRAGGKLEPRVRDYVGQLYDVLADNRDLVNLLQAAEPATDGAGLAAPLERLFETMSDVARSGGFPGDPMMRVRLTFGQVASLVVFDRWLWREGQPSRDEIVDALTEYMVGSLQFPTPSKRRTDTRE